MRIDAGNLKLLQQLATRDSGSASEDFGKMLMDALKEVNASQAESRALQGQFMAGQPVDVDDLMIAMERASISMQLTMQVRNKLLEGFQEIQRMQV